MGESAPDDTKVKRPNSSGRINIHRNLRIQASLTPSTGKSANENHHKQPHEVFMLTLKSLIRIKTQIEAAFEPLYCKAQVYDAGQKLRFKVFDKDYDVAFEIADLALNDLLDERCLSESIKNARSRINARRFRLNFGPDDQAGASSATTGPRHWAARSPRICS